MKTNLVFKKFILIFFVVIAIFSVGFLRVNKAQAAIPNTCACLNYSAAGSIKLNKATGDLASTSLKDCISKCSGGGYKGLSYTDSSGRATIRYFDTLTQAQYEKLKSTSDASVKANDDDVCPNLSWHRPMSWIMCIFLYILQFMGLLLSLAATMFYSIMDPANMMAIMNNQAIYQIWALVRDTLNVAFILVLLFSAFATIFQIDKYSYKNILLKLVIMALLVNFSYPITRFIIDFSNVLMYQILNNLGGNNFADIANSGGLKNIIHPAGNPGFLYIFAAIIFVFVLAVTFLMIAIMFTIRTIILTMLIIFSPVAFTGSIIPSLAGKVDSWWDNLFKYAFFGPIMIFMMYVATSMLASINTVAPTIQRVAGSETINSGLVASIAILSIPIVILWVGLGFAQSLSIAGAGAVTAKGKGAIQWAGKNLGGIRPATSWVSKKAGVTGGVKQRWNQFKISGPLGSEAQAQRESWVASKLGVRGAEGQDMKRRAKKLKDDGVSPEELEKRALAGDTAAAYRLAEDGKLSANTLKAIMDKTKNAKMREAILNKTAEKRMDITLQYKLAENNKKDETDPTKKNWSNVADVAKDEYGKLTAEKWAQQENLAEQFIDADIHKEATEAFGNLHESAQIEALKRMDGSNARAILS